LFSPLVSEFYAFFNEAFEFVDADADLLHDVAAWRVDFILTAVAAEESNCAPSFSVPV
jgi:hypothetical protein